MSSHDLPLNLLLSRHVLLKGGLVEKKEESMRFKLINPSHFPPLLLGRQTSPGGGSAAVGQKKKKQNTVICFHGGGRGPAPSCALAKSKRREIEKGRSEMR